MSTDTVGTVAASPVPVALGPKPAEPPIACTLDAAAMPDRMAEWQALLAHVQNRSTGVDGAVRVELDDEVSIEDVARLVAAEQHCCAFFAFAITVDGRGIGLEVRAPEGAAPIVESLFGEAT